MDTALATLIKSAAGTGAPTNQSSRYYGAAINTYTQPDGTPVVYLARRILPQPTLYLSVQSYAVVEHDRIDNLSNREQKRSDKCGQTITIVGPLSQREDSTNKERDS